MFVTVFTPTFNRAYILKNLYKSLLGQTVNNFEWLIIDDGSTDNTECIINEWEKEDNRFKIRYYKIMNGGKQRAINKGVQLAKGDLFFIVDSDDYLENNSVYTILSWFEKVNNNNIRNLAGIAGLKAHTDRTIIGRTFKGDFMDCYSSEIKKFGIIGDKAEVYFTHILKKFRIPEFDGEKFVPEEIYHYRIANAGYKLRYINTIIYICEYLEDGYTKHINQLLFENFKGYTLRCKELLTYNVGIKRKVEVIGKYSFMAEKKGLELKEIRDSLKANIILIWICQNLAKLYFNFLDQNK